MVNSSRFARFKSGAANRPAALPRSPFGVDRSRMGERRGSLDRRPPSAPSVSMTELNVFANQDKLRADANDDDEDEDDYEVYNGIDDAGAADDDLGENDDFQGRDESPLRQAAHVAGDVLDDQHFDFQDNEEDEGDEGDDAGSVVSRTQGSSGGSGRRHRRGPVSQRDAYGETQAMRRERVRLVAKLRRQQARLPEDERKRIDPDAPLNKLRDMSIGASYESRAKTAVLFMRRATVGLAKLVELVSTKLPPSARMDLEGWAENVYLTLDQFDDMLYDIYDEYGDQVQTSPLITFVMALGSNAVMYAMTKKLMQNPITGQMLGGLATAVRAQQNDQANRRAQNGPPGNPQGFTGSAVPPTTQRPAVAPHASDVMGHSASNPMADIGKALGGLDLGGLLGNLDLGGLLGGMSGQGAPPAHASCPPLSDPGLPVVKEMSAPSINTDEILAALRQGEDSQQQQQHQQMPPIPEEAEPDTEEPSSDVREVHFSKEPAHIIPKSGASASTRLSFE